MTRPAAPGEKNAHSEFLGDLLALMDRAFAAAELEEHVEEQAQSAKAAVSRIVGRIGHQDDPSLLAPGFSSHGFDHPRAMAQRFCELLECTVISLEQYELEQRIDVILWSMLAFVFHDIGMLIIPDSVNAHEDVSLADVWALDAVRAGHDQRSLVFIEQTLYSNVDAIPEWSDYWATRLNEPESGTHEILVLARICQSHGDSGDIWLKQDSLASYDRQLNDVDTRQVDFVRAFGTEGWAALRATVFAASTILNLVDLLDIRESRIHFPANAMAWKNSLPTTPEARRQRFLHWLGNKYCTLKVKPGVIEVETHPPMEVDESSVLREVLLDSAGPVADLLKYGRSERMSDALAECFGVRGLHIRLRRGQAYKWDRAEEEALSMPPGTWDHDDQNLDDLQRTRFDALVTRPLWFQLSCSAITHEPRAAFRGMGLTFSAALDSRVQGLEIEEAYVIDTSAISADAAYAVRVTSPSNYRTDSFFAGLRLARWLATQQSTPESSQSVKVHVAAPTSWQFADLTAGRWESDEASIILVVVNRSDPADVVKMVNSVDRTKTKLIFILSTPDLVSELAAVAHVQVVDAEYSAEVGGGFRQRVASLDLRDDRWELSLQDAAAPQETAASDEPGIGYLVRQWVTVRQDSLYGHIQFYLLDKDGPKYAMAQGALALLHMAEARRFGSEGRRTSLDVLAAFDAARDIPGVREAISPSAEIIGQFPFDRYATAFDPWDTSDGHDARLDAMDLHRTELSDAARTMLLFDALSMIALGEAFNPQHIDWSRLDRVIYPALRVGVKSMKDEEPGLRVGGEVTIPLATNAADTLDADRRWELARNLGRWGQSVGTDKGLVCFQAIYRLLRPAAPADAGLDTAGSAPRALGLDYVAEADDSATFLLGCLEAVCSGTITTDPESLEVGRGVVRDISSRIAEGGFPDVDVRMGFDVLFTYRELKVRTGLVEDGNALWRRGVEVGWDAQSVGVRSTPPIPVDPVFEKLRRRFDDLQEHTPARFKRELSPGIAELAREGAVSR